MSNKLNRIYIGSICNRDLEVFDKIKKFCSKNYNISIINLIKKGSNTFSARFFKKQLKKYPISFIIIKLLSKEDNQEIYNAINESAPNIPLLNSTNIVKTCESRKDTIRMVKKRCKKLSLPSTFFSFSEAYDACANGTKIIIKLDRHNIPDLPREGRIIGIAKSVDELTALTQSFNENELFFQEYLEKIDIIYKVYVVGRWLVSITSHNRMRKKGKLTPLELIHIRVPIEKQLKRRILRMGRKLGLAIFGIDYILTKEGIPYIIDINDFPSFRSIPEAISLISDYIYNVLILQQQVFKVPARARG